MFNEYTGNRQFDLQLNRTFAPILDRSGMETIASTTLPRLRTTDQITELAWRLAERFSSEGDARAAWRLYWPGLVLWAGCFEGCWLLLVVLCPLARVLVG